MQKLYKEYNKKSIVDTGAYASKEFKSFYRKFINAMKRTFPDMEVVNSHCGHYDLSGFLKKEDQYVYFNYSVPRGDYPINMDKFSYSTAVLYRLAKSDKDYKGGQNHFAMPLKLRQGIYELLISGEKIN